MPGKSKAMGMTMQENTTIRKQIEFHTCRLRATCTWLAVAALTGCAPSAPNASSGAATNDSAAAYAALSATLEQCEQAQQSCYGEAGMDLTARAQCDNEAASCNAKAQDMEQQAQTTLEHEAHHCRQVCGEEDAGPGGPDDADAGSGDMHACLARHAPKLPKCLAGLVSCLDDAGIRQRAATRAQVGACLHEAHSCFKAEFAALRAARRARHMASAPSASDAGTAASTASAADSGSASSPTDPARMRHASPRPIKPHWPLPFWR